MKKHIVNLFLFSIFLSLMVSCDKDDSPSPEKKPVVVLPEMGATYLKTYLPDKVPSEITISDDKQTYKASYQRDSLYVIFDKDGNWLKAKAVKILPSSMFACLPASMQEAAEKLHVNDTIKSIEVKEYGYRYGISSGSSTIYLGYNAKGIYLGTDKTAQNVLSDESISFIAKYWKDAQVSSVLFNAENYSKRYYLVYLTNQFIIRFNYNKGTWQKVDGVNQPLSDQLLALIPQSVLDLVKELDKEIVSMEIEQKGLYSFKYSDGSGYTLITEDYEGEEASSEEVYASFRAFVVEHWGTDIGIVSTSWSSTDPQVFHYVLDNGVSISYNVYKNWQRIESADNDESIPISVLNTLPSSVMDYVKSNYNNSYLVIMVERKDGGYSLRLSNEVQSFFDKNGKFIKEVKGS